MQVNNTTLQPLGAHLTLFVSFLRLAKKKKKKGKEQLLTFFLGYGDTSCSGTQKEIKKWEDLV